MKTKLTDLELFDSGGERIGHISPVGEKTLSNQFCSQYCEWRRVNSGFFFIKFNNSPSKVKNWFLSEVIQDDGRRVYAVKDLNGNFVGVCGFKNLLNVKVELDTMMRGESSGHPQIMVAAQRALLWFLFSEVGVKTVTGKVLSKNILARIFHKRFGFAEIRRSPLIRVRHNKIDKLVVAKNGSEIEDELIDIKLTSDSYKSNLKPYEW